MQAIVTKYLGPTDHRGARIKARWDGGFILVPWDHALDVYGNHRMAAHTLQKKLQWDGWYEGGLLPGSMGYAWVYVPTK